MALPIRVVSSYPGSLITIKSINKMLRKSNRKNASRRVNRGRNDIVNDLRSRNIRYFIVPIGKSIRPADPVYSIRLPIQVSRATVASGIFANTYQISGSSVNNFSTRVAPLFREFVVIKGEIEFMASTTANAGSGTPAAGIWLAWLRETDTTTPTAADAANNQTINIKNNVSGDVIYRAVWDLKAPFEANWQLSSGASGTFFSVKVLANTGAPSFFNSGDSSSSLIITGFLTFLFRSFTNT